MPCTFTWFPVPVMEDYFSLPADGKLVWELPATVVVLRFGDFLCLETGACYGITDTYCSWHCIVSVVLSGGVPVPLSDVMPRFCYRLFGDLTVTGDLFIVVFYDATVIPRWSLLPSGWYLRLRCIWYWSWTVVVVITVIADSVVMPPFVTVTAVVPLPFWYCSYC